ncbi:MAG: DNA-processing protein DprA [Patescibacteria group bacterium]
MSITTINIKDKNYPKLLKEIYDPPEKIYILGNIEAVGDLQFAVVGTRKMSREGKEIASRIVKNLAQNGFTIISGLALGIDGVAHQAALEAKGKTVAVLGSGLNNIYPSAHKKLADQIIASGGAIISEYEPDMPPLKHQFPERNRIISGLSLGTLVIEAPFKSGALITARCALEQNREVFAVPGSILSLNSEGPNYLIKMGAHPVAKAEDILEIFDINPQIKNDEKNFTVDELKIIAIIKNQPAHIDEIIRLSYKSSSEINSLLTIMEMSGKIKNLGNGYYHLNN